MRANHLAVPCRACGAVRSVEVVDSVNVEREPEVRAAILERSLHVFTCPGCGAENVLDKEFLYIDLERKQFFGVFPIDRRADERACGERIAAAFHRALGDKAPSGVKAWSQDFQVRLCFGQEEVREKLLASDAGLWDLHLEALKADILSGRPEFAQELVQTLRFQGVNEHGDLIMAAEHAGDPPRLDLESPLIVERAFFDEIAQVSWQTILEHRPGLASGPHVSLLRLPFAGLPGPPR